jgi:hypothetical protein
MPTTKSQRDYKYQQKIKTRTDDEVVAIALGRGIDPEFLAEQQSRFRETKRRIQAELKRIPRHGTGRVKNGY